MTDVSTVAPERGRTAPSLTITRVITGAPQEVFDAWTQPEVMSAWWGPESLNATECSVDLREDGDWRVVMRAPDGSDYIMCGQYVRIDQPRELVFTWAWETDGERGEETLVTLTFQPQGSNTTLTLLHEKFSSQETCDRHHEGWSSSLNCLEKHFA